MIKTEIEAVDIAHEKERGGGDHEVSREGTREPGREGGGRSKERGRVAGDQSLNAISKRKKESGGARAMLTLTNHSYCSQQCLVGCDGQRRSGA